VGIEMDVRHLTAEQRQSLKQWIALYKSLRDHLHSGRVWCGDVGDGAVWQAHGDEAANELIIFVYRLTPTTHRYTPPLRLPMLDEIREYQIERLDPTPGDWTSSPLNDALRAHEPIVAHGAWLAQAGLPLPRMNAESALIYRLRANSLP